MRKFSLLFPELRDMLLYFFQEASPDKYAQVVRLFCTYYKMTKCQNLHETPPFTPFTFKIGLTFYHILHLPPVRSTANWITYASQSWPHTFISLRFSSLLQNDESLLPPKAQTRLSWAAARTHRRMARPCWFVPAPPGATKQAWKGPGYGTKKLTFVDRQRPQRG